MAEEKANIVVSSADAEAILERLNVVEAKLAALETGLIEQPNYGGSVSSSKNQKTPLSGQTFKVAGDEYRAVYPKFLHGARTVTEAELLEDKKLQKELVDGGFKVIRKVSAVIAFLLMFAFGVSATGITINPYSAEVVSTGFKKRDLYQLQDLLIIYYATTEAFEVQTAESRSKIFGGDIDSVTISGASTAAAKLAYLRTLMLEATTTNGYKVFIGRNNVEFYYASATNRVDVKYGRNKQPLWFGHIDSLKANGTSTTLAYLRLINRYKAQDCLPSTSVATIAAGAAAGSSPTVAVTGDAFSGSISVTTGTSATTGTLATVTLKITAPTGTRIALTGTNANACLHAVRWHGAGTTTTLVITVPATALSDATAYTWNYTVVPY